MASQEESVREFVAVTDVDEERARFFLESAGWNLQVRVISQPFILPNAVNGSPDTLKKRPLHGMCQTVSLPANASLCCR